MNLVAMIGNVASEPEFRTTPGGKPVCSFRLAISRANKDSADFFTIVTWDRQAEICKQYIDKGRRIGVEGRLHHSTWKTDEGEGRSKVEIVAHRVQLLASKKRADFEPGGDLDEAVAERADFAPEPTPAYVTEAAPAYTAEPPVAV